MIFKSWSKDNVLNSLFVPFVVIVILIYGCSPYVSLGLKKDANDPGKNEIIITGAGGYTNPERSANILERQTEVAELRATTKTKIMLYEELGKAIRDSDQRRIDEIFLMLNIIHSGNIDDADLNKLITQYKKIYSISNNYNTKETSEIMKVRVIGISNNQNDDLQTNRNEAIIDAKRKAIEKAGIQIISKTTVKMGILYDDYIETFSEAAILPGFEIIDIGYDNSLAYKVVLIGEIKIKK